MTGLIVPKLCNVVRTNLIKYNLEYLKESVLHIKHRKYNKDYQQRHEIMDMVTSGYNGLQWNKPYSEIELIKTVI